MRRMLALLALAALAAACSGKDAQEAQQLLAQSDAAFADVRSASFSAKLWVEGSESLSFVLSGGGYVKGKRADDSYFVITGDNAYFHDLVVVQRSGRISASLDGHVVSGLNPSSGSGSVGIADIGPYVKDVRVERGKLIDGEPMTKIAGLIDTEGVVNGYLGQITEIAGLGDASLDVSKIFGDTHFVLYLSEATHLPMRELVDMPVQVAGETVVLHMDFAYTSFNDKLRFPGLR